MNKPNQMRPLLIFQLFVTPRQILIIFPLVLALPYFMSSLIRMISHSQEYNPPIIQLLANQQSFFVTLIGFFLLAPELSRTGASTVTWPTGTEFLLTRALDRNLIFRARAITFYALILTIPLLVLLGSFTHPALQITEYQKIPHQAVLDQLPGSIPAAADKYGLTTKIILPYGNIIIDTWRIWWLACLAIITQAFIALVYPWKKNKFILWSFYAVVIGGSFFGTLAFVHAGNNLSVFESLFFTFTHYQFLFWSATIILLIFIELWSEHRFATAEH